MYFFNFFRNQLWQHFLISQQLPNSSIQKYEHVLLEVAMCEKCRVTNKGGGRTNSFFLGGEEVTFAGELL